MTHATTAALPRGLVRPARALRAMWAAIALSLACAALPVHQARAQMTLDLRDVDLRSFVQIVSEQTGRNFILDPDVSGVVTVLAPAPVSARTVHEIFLNVLELNDLTIVEGAEVDRIVRMRSAPQLGASPGAGRGGAFETRVLPVQSADLDELIDVLLPLMPPDAVLTPIFSAGVLVLSDRRENIDRIATLIARLDQGAEPVLETLRLDHARAEDLVGVIEALAVVPPGARLSADSRANAIVATGPAEFRDRIRAVVRELDTPQRRAVSQVVRLNYADATELADVVRQSIGGSEDSAQNPVTVVAEPQSNAILLTAPGDRIDSLAQSVRALDTRPAQVLIEAVIFEIAAENFADLSVQFGAVFNDAFGGGTSFDLDGRSSLISVLSAAFAGNLPNPGSGGALGAVQQGSFAALLTALARERSTRLLSTPAVLTLNNREAEIVVAQNVPFVTGRFSTIDGGAIPEQPFQTIERQDVGLTLTVRPQITDDNTVRMAISQEVSNLTGSVAAAGGEVTARRRLNTNAMVRDGRVIILGGLIEDSSRTSTERVPGLSNLPLIGAAFRGRAVQEGQRVLLVMLRPRVIRSDSEATALTRELARQTETLSRQIAPRSDSVYPTVQRSGFPFDGVDLNQPFDAVHVDKAVRDRLFPALPPRLAIGTGQ